MQKTHFKNKNFQNILDNSKETLAHNVPKISNYSEQNPNHSRKFQIIPKKTNHSNKSQIIPQKAKNKSFQKPKSKLR
jgi:hypothetical protein